MKKCPYCAESIQEEAIKCRFCGEFFVKNPQTPAQEKEKWYFKTSFLVIAFLCVGPLMLPLIWLKPALSRGQKIIISAVITVISIILAVLLINSIKSITNYYKQLFSLTY